VPATKKRGNHSDCLQQGKKYQDRDKASRRERMAEERGAAALAAKATLSCAGKEKGENRTAECERSGRRIFRTRNLMMGATAVTMGASHRFKVRARRFLHLTPIRPQLAAYFQRRETSRKQTSLEISHSQCSVSSLDWFGWRLTSDLFLFYAY
jgi:hypothetical protein